MKQHLTKSQCVLMSKEAVEDLLSPIPFVVDVEITNETEEGTFSFQACVSFQDSSNPIIFFAEVHTNGELRYANRFISNHGQISGDSCRLFIAPYISESAAKMLYENHCSYLDLCGNCYILTHNIIIHNSGNPNKYMRQRSKKNYFFKSSPAVSAILRTMLNEPDRFWKVKELSDVTGKAIGTVSNVKAFLVERDSIEESDGMFRLKNIKELLYSWSKDYNSKADDIRQFYSLESIPDTEAAISSWSRSNGNKAFLSGFSAAARYAPVVRYSRINVFVEPDGFKDFIRQLGLHEVSSGGNVFITIPHDETPGMFLNNNGDSVVASPVQSILDLLGMPGRGEEAADAIISKEFKR